jgi:hypothetical protein
LEQTAAALERRLANVALCAWSQTWPIPRRSSPSFTNVALLRVEPVRETRTGVAGFSWLDSITVPLPSFGSLKKKVCLGSDENFDINVPAKAACGWIIFYSKGRNGLWRRTFEPLPEANDG